MPDRVYTNWDLEKYATPQFTMPETIGQPGLSEREITLQKKMDELLSSVQPGVKHTRATSAITAAGVISSELERLRGGRAEERKIGLAERTSGLSEEEKRKQRLMEMDRLGLEARKLLGAETQRESTLEQMAQQATEAARGREASLLERRMEERGKTQRQIGEQKFKVLLDPILGKLSESEKQKLFDSIESLYGGGAREVTSTTQPTGIPEDWRSYR